MRMRLKFCLNGIIKRVWNKEATELSFSAVSGSHENLSFENATPNGTLAFTVKDSHVQPKILDMLGQEFYVEVTPAKAEAKAT